MNPSRWIDLQVNGYCGVDFNADELSLDDVLKVCEILETDGVASILPTIITAPLDLMIQRIKRLADWIDSVPALAAKFVGIHVEGPFINSQIGYVGAHPPLAVLPATVDAADRLINAGGGHVKLVTLAPECDDNFDVISWLSGQRILVAGGHSDATWDQLNGAIDAGMKLFTHLGNGCPGVMHRHDNIIQRVLNVSDRIAVSFIADGHHVPPFALQNYLNLVPDENIVIVSDAISAAGLGPGDYQLSGQTVHVDDAGAAWAADRTHFAGSAATLAKMRSVLRSMAITDDRIDRWMIDNPKRLLALVM
jgi:N-acetylglucosamine-6-phosphate deacetylase